MNQQNEIAKIAYELYLMRNGAPGDPVADWLMAERIFAERSERSMTMRALQEPVMAQEPNVLTTEDRKPAEAPVFLGNERKKTVKTEAKKTTAPKKEVTKPAAAKAAPAKAEAKPVVDVKPAVEAKPKRVIRKKTATE